MRPAGGGADWRFDPVFLAGGGTGRRPVPVNWNSLLVTGGVGRDLPLAEHWTPRPIVNFTRGYVCSDLDISSRARAT